jgi:AcrR family transcriptional regulator
VTRRAILDAAREVFAGQGYDGATIRSIAAEAGVDPALVHHHFGTKEDLFVAATEFPFSPALIEAAIRGTDGTIGERLARAYLTAVLDGGAIEALIRSAMTNRRARGLLREFVESAVLDAFEGYVEGPDARLRMALAGSHLVGVVMFRRIIGVGALVETDVEDIVQMVAPALDRYLEPSARG